MNQEKSQKGFSLMEVILVVLLMSIAIGFSVLYYQSSQVRADINAQTSELAGYLRLQQSRAESGLEGGIHSIHLEEDSYSLFSGAVFNEEDNQNKTTQMPETIRIININLNGGGNDIIFSSPQGSTENYGTFEIYSDQIKKTNLIEVTEMGTINY
jgi:prepilin-type N-terminal cleavage/methylation domain-containing protein